MEHADWRVRLNTSRDGVVTHGAYDNFAAWRGYATEQRDLYERGYHRVWDPLREPEAAEEAGGEIADPLVRADYLIERGHPRGPLIVAGHDPAIVAAHEDVLLGPLASEHLKLSWERGYIARASIVGFQDDGEDRLWDLLRHPSGRYLRELIVGCHQAGDQDNRLMAATLLHAGPTPPLEVLELADFDESEIDNIDISRAPLGDLRGLGQKYPLLRSVELKGNYDLRLGDLSLPWAQKFALRTSALSRQVVDSICEAAWPALEELELWFGDDEYGGDCTLDDALRVLRLDLPALRVLRLMNAPFTDELAPHLARAALVKQLRVLDLGLGTLSDAGARVLIAHAESFQHLDALGVHENSLSTRGLASLRAVVPADETLSSPARAHRTSRQKRSRYVSVTEYSPTQRSQLSFRNSARSLGALGPTQLSQPSFERFVVGR